MAKKTSELQFKVLIEQDEDGYFVASVPELPNCHTQARTLEEVRKRIREAIKLYLGVHKELKEEKAKTPASLINFFGIEDIKINYA